MAKYELRYEDDKFHSLSARRFIKHLDELDPLDKPPVSIAFEISQIENPRKWRELVAAIKGVVEIGEANFKARGPFMRDIEEDDFNEFVEQLQHERSMLGEAAWIGLEITARGKKYTANEFAKVIRNTQALLDEIAGGGGRAE